MATTYTSIASITVTSLVTSVTFSNIPATYTDLVLKATNRDTRSNPSYADAAQMELNSDATQNNYKGGLVYAINTSQTTDFSTGGGYNNLYGLAADSTPNAFATTDVYIASYTSTTAKTSFCWANAAENNFTSGGACWRAMSSTFRDDTASITNIRIVANGNNFVTNTTFYLYGILNS